MLKIPASMMLLKCGRCGHEDDFDLFCQTPIGGDLPPGTHQCPACKRAWRMESQGDGKRYPSGLVIPPTRKAVTIPTIL
jgi:hypothetical protein